MVIKKNISGKKIVIIGLSRSGEAAAYLAKQAKAKVYVSEVEDNSRMRRKTRALKRLGIAVELGGHTPAFFSQAQILLPSPGVKNSNPAVVWAKRKKVPVISEIEFAGWFCAKPVTAITGSNGKTTVTTLLGKIFESAKKKAEVCGNIGIPFSSRISQCQGSKLVVLEVSSFQLQYINKFRAHVSVILNITQNHFDYHHSMREYIAAKANILRNQKSTDFCVLNYDDKLVCDLAKKTRAKVLFFSKKPRPFLRKSKDCYGYCWLEGNKIVSYWRRKQEDVLFVDLLKIKGLHNVENTMAAFLAARAQDIKKEEIVKVLLAFKGVEHRCEPVARKNGINFINDSKSTTVDATEKAISMFPDKSLILICGGRDKGSDFSVISELIAKKVYLLIVIGEAADIILKSMDKNIKARKAATFEEAVKLAYRKALKGMNVLLSPMCSSFDMFKNFEHRGKVFKAIVRGLN
ncbi:MAG: UDP-N-acetylmuramoyl-L-alanine--D-glutamate ligase [Candidatus Omnitrophica bacterium]|nr:UDP-N-acetylmuramoyl-L-alanine--D-glutamate ligase [Candidatus Omnitrophota bacterium]